MISRKSVFALLVFATLALVETDAGAKNGRTLDYRFRTIWSTTVRLLRVDRGYEITDKDRDTGYILFVFPGSGAVKKCPGSVEVVPVVDKDGYRRHRVLIQIAHQPSYIEISVLDALSRKLRSEYGDPPPPERIPRKPPSKDPPSEKPDAKDPDPKAPHDE